MYGRANFDGNLYGTLFVAFAHHGKDAMPLPLPQAPDARPYDIHAAQSRPNHQGEHRLIPQPQQRVCLHRVQKLLRLIPAQSQRFALLADRKASYPGRRIDLDKPPIQRLRKQLAADGNFAADRRDCAGLPLAFQSRDLFASKPASIGMQVVSRHVPNPKVPSDSSLNSVEL